MALIAASRYESSDSATSDKHSRTKKSYKPSTSTYDDNFNFAFSFYQPMIDYLDKKISGVSTAKDGLPHLPYTDEVAVKSRSSDNDLNNCGIRRANSYTKRDIANLMDASDRQGSKSTGLSSRSTNSASGSSSYGSKSVRGPESSVEDRGSVKLGMSKSTSTSTLSTQYSMSKMSIRQALTSKSPTVTALEEGKLERNRDLKLASLTKTFGLDRQRDSAFSTSSTITGIRRTRSFGAFTEKSVSDVKTELTVDAIQKIAGKYKILLAKGPISQSSSSNSEVMQSRDRRKVRFNESEETSKAGTATNQSTDVSVDGPIKNQDYINAIQEAVTWKDTRFDRNF